MPHHGSLALLALGSAVVTRRVLTASISGRKGLWICVADRLSVFLLCLFLVVLSVCFLFVLSVFCKMRRGDVAWMLTWRSLSLSLSLSLSVSLSFFYNLCFSFSDLCPSFVFFPQIPDLLNFELRKGEEKCDHDLMCGDVLRDVAVVVACVS